MFHAKNMPVALNSMFTSMLKDSHIVQFYIYEIVVKIEMTVTALICCLVVYYITITP